MLLRKCYNPSRTLSLHKCTFTSCNVLYSASPNPDLNLNSSTKALLQNAGISLKTQGHAARTKSVPSTPRGVYKELEVYPVDASDIMALEADEDDIDEGDHKRPTRKSPAAEFGSKAIGTVTLPDELQHAITELVQSALHIAVDHVEY